MQNVFFSGAKVIYQYYHFLNSKSVTIISKQGIIIRSIRSQKGLQRPTGFYLVQIQGNKCPSRIHESLLRLI